MLEFFIECDRLSLNLDSVHSILKQCVGDAPSYRKLQEWKRGGYASPLTPFNDWLAVLQLAVGEPLTAPDSTGENIRVHEASSDSDSQ
jgi:hypothetical protein